MPSRMTIAPVAEENRSDLICHRMVQELTEGIQAGRLKAGDRILPEIQLKKQYGISVTSVRRGMDLLVRQGLIVRQRGSGTFVCEPPTVQAPVRRDTVMLCEGVVHPFTHPFFGQMRRSLCSRLEELGWKIRSLVPPSDIPYEMAGERPKYYSEYTPELVAKTCDSLSNLAGIILSGLPDTYADEIMKLDRPYVTLSSGWNHPSITYDWEKELFRAMSVAIEAGIRSLWVVSAIPLEKVNALARAAAVLANDKGPSPVVTHIIPSQLSRTYSATTLSAYTGVRERLPSGLPEAIAVHGDFETQGVLDALAENEDAVKRPPLIVALVNKASQIHSRFPYTALVADGFALGEAAADLLQEQITNPDHAPRFVRMSCMVRGEPGGLPGPAMAMSKSNMIEGKQAKNQEAAR